MSWLSTALHHKAARRTYLEILWIRSDSFIMENYIYFLINIYTPEYLKYIMYVLAKKSTGIFRRSREKELRNRQEPSGMSLRWQFTRVGCRGWPTLGNKSWEWEKWPRGLWHFTTQHYPDMSGQVANPERPLFYGLNCVKCWSSGVVIEHPRSFKHVMWYPNCEKLPEGQKCRLIPTWSCGPDLEVWVSAGGECVPCSITKTW